MFASMLEIFLSVTIRNEAALLWLLIDRFWLA